MSKYISFRCTECNKRQPMVTDPIHIATMPRIDTEQSTDYVCIYCKHVGWMGETGGWSEEESLIPAHLQEPDLIRYLKNRITKLEATIKEMKDIELAEMGYSVD